MVLRSEGPKVRGSKGVYRLMPRNSEAWSDFRYRSQLFDAASSVEANIAEGWRRFGAGEMVLFLRYALASLEEAKLRLKDGVDRGYFKLGDCAAVFELGNRCGAATMALLRSLQGFSVKARRS